MLGEEPSLGEGVGVARLNKYNLGPSPGSRVPQHAFYIAGKFMQLLSVYAAYHYLVTTEAPIVPFVFFCLLVSALIFLIAQRPWKGRPLSSAQWLPTVINGGIMALQLVLWAYGLRTCGPIRTIMAEYAGAVVGAFSIVLFGRRGHRWAKLRGLLTMLAAFYLLSQGWAMDSAFPFSRHFRPSKEEEPAAQEKGHVGLGSMTLPVVAGLVGALRRLLARRVGMKTQSKRRLHSVTVASAAAFMFPIAVFQLTAGASVEPLLYEGSALKVYLLVIVFNIVLGFYGDTFAEEKLQLGPATPKHLAATVISACVLETVYRMDFSLPGYLACSILLWIGIFWASATDKIRRDTWGDQSGADLSKERRRSSVVGALPTYMQGPLEHVLADSKSRRIALFLIINMAFMVVEFTFGFLSNSLGLISDACHMLFDCAALAIGLYASYITRLQANSTYTYGYGRYEVLSGYVNAVFLVFVATLIVLESIERMLDPPNISTENILLVSVGGLLVNVLGLVFFHEAHAHAHGGSCSHSHGHSHSHHDAKKPLLSSHDSLSASKPQHSHHDHHSEKIHSADNQSSHSHDSHDHHHRDYHKHDHHSHEEHHKHDHDEGSHHHDRDNGHRDQLSHDHHHHEQDASCGHGHMHSNERHAEHEGVHVHGPACAHGDNGHGHKGHGHHKHDHHGERHDHHSHGDEGCGTQHECGKDHDHGHGHEHGHGGHGGCDHSHHGHEHGHDDHGHDHDGDKHHHQEDGKCGQDHIHTEDLGLGNAHMDHNMHGIFLHVLADTLGSIGVVISTLLIKYKGWLLTDPACSIFISVLIVSSVVPLLKNVAELVLQRVPRAAEAAIAQTLEQVAHLDGVLGHQKAHFWSFTPKMVVGSLHVQVHAAADKQHVRRRVCSLFRSMGIGHMTVQVEDDSFHSHADEIASYVDSMTGRLDALGSFS